MFQYEELNNTERIDRRGIDRERENRCRLCVCEVRACVSSIHQNVHELVWTVSLCTCHLFLLVGSTRVSNSCLLVQLFQFSQIFDDIRWFQPFQ